ncbi:unnamed protein product [Pylaiella littoralis]
MGFRTLSLLLPFGCVPICSFFLPSAYQPFSTPLRNEPCHNSNFNSRAGNAAACGAGGTSAHFVEGCREHGVSMGLSSSPHHPRSPFGAEGGASRSPRTTLRSHPVQLSAEESATLESTEPQELPGFISNEGVSYWVHPTKASNIWLVGVVHGTKTGVQIVEEVIGGIKPEVVMVELDSDRICLLPPGEAMETRNGLWWWSPEKQPGGATEELEDDGVDEDEDEDDDDNDNDRLSAEVYNEIKVAVREAGACGARVLLGDREYESTVRLLEKAKRLDMASAQERREFNELTTSFDCGEESTRAITRKECEQMKATAPNVFSVMCTKRDQIFAKHLMKLRGDQTTVAVFGMAHLDGVEKVLKGHGWKRQRA